MRKRTRRHEFSSSERSAAADGRAPGHDLDVHWLADDPYRLAFEVAPVGLLIEDLDGRNLGMNPYLRRMLGLTADEARSPDALAALTTPADARRMAELTQQVRAGAIHDFDIELRVTTRDGRSLVLHKVGARIPGATDARLVCVFTDITVQKRQQEILRQRDVQLGEGERLAELGSFDLCLRTGELSWTDGLYRLFGFEPHAIVPTLAFVRDRIVPEDRPAFDADLGRLRNGDSSYAAERRIVRQDGEERVWRIQARLRRNGDAPPRIVGVVQDVTEQRAAERIKDEVVAVVSHELRTPLTMILAPLLMLERGQLDPASDAGREILRYARESAEHMTHLVRDIFDLGRLQTGNLTIRPRAFDLAAFLRHEIDARCDAGASVALAVEAPPAMMAWGDPDRIQQVLTNLLDNAIAYTPPGGQVRVEATDLGAEVHVAVRDQGPGVPVEHRDTVFERFRQLDPPATRSRGGTGLGLTISKHLVERHGGRIWIDAAAGGGALVSFTLPARPPAAL